jgi:hypothetical protein
LEKAQKGFLNAVQGVIGPHAFPSHQPHEPCSVGVHKRRHPAEKSFGANVLIHDQATTKRCAASASRCASVGETCFASLA